VTVLAINKPFTSDLPVLLVETKLPAGLHRFQLEVIDNRGVVSLPDVITVQVGKPLVVIKPALNSSTPKRRSLP
jgi:hypothetical protein